MHEILSIHARGNVLSVVGAIVVTISGCRPSYPLVVNSTEPWEEQLARERQAARDAEYRPPQSSVARQMHDKDEENQGDAERERSEVVVAVTDIIGFPFRGAGWLARQIF